ncbi:MAG: murein biosynthesis integral membrane protein MurJ [Patescibacteria group bacterium]|nr:murein biosynthesis integral membrane protein MurJ [Patescibacteria group bacterium]
MIKKLFTTQINSITVAALLVALSSLVSRFLGIFRDRILAGEFGAGDALDVYYTAFRVPDLIFNLLVLGALSAGFIPLFVSLFESKLKHKHAWELANNALNILGLALIVISSIGILFAPFLMKLVAPGFSGEKQLLVISLTRIMFLSPMFLGLSSVFGGVLQSLKRFFIYSLAPIFYNIGIIIGALYFVPKFGLHGLAWGVVLGAFFHLFIQASAAFHFGFRYKLIFNLRDKNIREILRLMLPRTMSLAIAQINLLVITVVASTLNSGSIAIFNFANNLQSFPIGIFGISFAVAAFPAFSREAFDKKKLVSSFSTVIRQILFFIVPSTVLLLTLRAQLIRVILGTGQFDWQDTVLTINTLGFFALSLFAQASLPLLVRVFYARHNSSTPFFVGLFSATINVVLALYLSRSLGVAGLALAFSLANIINFFVLWVFLRFELGDLEEERILFSAVKFSIAALASGLAIQGSKLLVWPYVDMTRLWGVLTQGLLAGIAGIIIYIAFCSLLKSEEFIHFWQAGKRRLSWRKVNVNDQGEARGI